MQDRRILVTGGAGFIGSNLANRLADTNDVLVVDDEYLGDLDHLDPAVTVHRQSVLERDLPTDVDVVVHLAALSSYDMHESNPGRGVRVNVEGFVNVVEQARASGCQDVVYASTSSLYGSHTTPQSDPSEVSITSGYTASKRARELYATYFHHHYGMRMIGLRFYSVYQGLHAAESHKGPYANIISQFADTIARGAPPVVFGDGTQTRDFIHVDDVVEACVAAIESAPTGRYDVGTGCSTSFNTVISELNSALDRAVEPTYVDHPMPQDVYIEDTCANPEPLTDACGWRPSITVEQGIRRLCDSYDPASERDTVA